jgi:hypothetical protein
VVKSTGLGVTELMLRYIVYRCLRDQEWKNRQVAIVTGPNIDLATKLIKRIKKLILLSEADFFGPSQETEVRYVTERYMGKSDPYIVLESTPNAPGRLFQTIENETDSIYKKMRLDYTVGLNKIYTDKEIERAKKSITFEREYNLKYLGHIGNSYHTEDILRATNYTYDPDFINPSSARVISCDPAYASSNFGLCITDVRDGRICVLLAEEHKHATSEQMLPYVYDLMQKYEPIDYVFVDGSQIDFIKGLKSMAGNEEVDYHAAIERYKKDKVDWTLCMIIQPFLFNTESKKRMLTHTRNTLEQGNLMIDKRFDILINALHNCSDSEGIIDKNFAGNDCLDSLMMCLQGYE